jgi:hypothetical protein
MNPQELSKLIGIDSKAIRKFARNQFHKGNGGWDFDEVQVGIIKNHFKGAPVSVKEVPAIAAPTQFPEVTWDSVVGLTLIARKFLKETYGLELNIPININSRLSRALGRFRHYPRTGQPLDIEISRSVIENHGEEATIDVLKHELVHYALFTLNKPFADGHPVFENELKRLGVSRTHTYQKKGRFKNIPAVAVVRW